MPCCQMQVAGLLVLNAHNVTDTSGDGFAMRLFRRGNQRGFIRALSDQPSFFAAGFNKASPHKHRKVKYIITFTHEPKHSHLWHKSIHLCLPFMQFCQLVSAKSRHHRERQICAD